MDIANHTGTDEQALGRVPLASKIVVRNRCLGVVNVRAVGSLPPTVFKKTKTPIHVPS